MLCCCLLKKCNVCRKQMFDANISVQIKKCMMLIGYLLSLFLFMSVWTFVRWGLLAFVDGAFLQWYLQPEKIDLKILFEQVVDIIKIDWSVVVFINYCLWNLNVFYEENDTRGVVLAPRAGLEPAGRILSSWTSVVNTCFQESELFLPEGKKWAWIWLKSEHYLWCSSMNILV